MRNLLKVVIKQCCNIHTVTRNAFWLMNFSGILTDTGVWDHLSDSLQPIFETENGLIAISLQQPGMRNLLQKQNNKPEGSLEAFIKVPSPENPNL